MRRGWTLGVVVAGALALAPVAAARDAQPGDAASRTWVVTIEPGAKLAVEGRVIGPRDVVIEATDAEAAALVGDRGIVAVEPDQPAAALDLPVDPCLRGLGCPVAGDQSGLLRIGAELAWSVESDADGVVVGIIDAGVDATHPDLAGRVTAVNPGPGGCAALPAALGADDRTATGHGTRVAGIIAAVGDRQGVAGVAWRGARLRSYTALGADLRGSTSDVVAALHCAIDDGVDVVNLSLSTGDTTAMRNALARAEAAGVVVVAAAGNGADAAHPGVYPAAHPTVVAVTAATADGERRAPFANGGSWVDLAAPGTDIVSTSPGSRWTVGDGTSYAAPFVTGAAALVLGRDGALTPAQLRARLASTAEVLADTSVGWGLVDLASAVRFPTAGAAACAVGRAWVLDAYGGIHSLGGAPAVSIGAYWPGWDIARDLATVATLPGGYVLDGHGALHAFGGAPAVQSPAYRPGWDVARAADRRPDGSVVVLDGQGGLHVTGRGAGIGPGGPWWPGLDMARDVVVDPTDPSRAYVLDAFGGVHLAGAGGDPPDIDVTRYTPGRDLARELVLLPGGGRGYVVDAGGRLHPWAVDGQEPPPAAAAATATGTTGGAAATADGRLLTVSAAGALVPVGDSPCATADRWSGRLLARAVALAP